MPAANVEAPPRRDFAGDPFFETRPPAPQRGDTAPTLRVASASTLSQPLVSHRTGEAL
jgi:hypothetical protein